MSRRVLKPYSIKEMYTMSIRTVENNDYLNLNIYRPIFDNTFIFINEKWDNWKNKWVGAYISTNWWQIFPETLKRQPGWVNLIFAITIEFIFFNINFFLISK